MKELTDKDLIHVRLRFLDSEANLRISLSRLASGDDDTDGE